MVFLMLLLTQRPYHLGIQSIAAGGAGASHLHH